MNWLFKHIPGIPGLPGLSSGLLNPWVILGVVLAAAGIAGTGFHYGRAFCEGQHARAALTAERAYEQAYQAQAEHYNAAAQALQARQASVRVVTRTIKQEVAHVITRRIYRNVCLDSDGVRLANDALAGRAPNSAGTHAAVPPAHAAP